MATFEMTRADALIEALASLTPSGIRRAFPAHERLEDCQLVYDARGVGHIRTIRTGRGPRMLCGLYGDIISGSYTSLHGVGTLYRATCEGCYAEGRVLRDAIEDEREPLRVAIAHARAISSILNGLREAA